MFRKAKHQIQVLNRHAGRPLPEIVKAGHQQDVARLVWQDAQRDAVGLIKSLRVKAKLVSFAGIAQRFDFDEPFVLVTRR
jgi:hypothetical protein